MNKIFEIIINKKAKKDLKILKSTPFFEIIVRNLYSMSINPFEGDVKKLESFSICDYRRRVGNYRILFDIDLNHKEIIIHRIVHRKDAYRNI